MTDTPTGSEAADLQRRLKEMTRQRDEANRRLDIHLENVEMPTLDYDSKYLPEHLVELWAVISGDRTGKAIHVGELGPGEIIASREELRCVATALKDAWSRIAELEAKLAAAVKERDELRKKLQDTCCPHGCETTPCDVLAQEDTDREGGE